MEKTWFDIFLFIGNIIVGIFLGLGFWISFLKLRKHSKQLHEAIEVTKGTVPQIMILYWIGRILIVVAWLLAIIIYI